MASKSVPHPLVLEIHARAWMHEMRGLHGNGFELGSVSESIIEHWVALGLTHLWLMGVWQVGVGAVHHAKSLASYTGNTPGSIPGPEHLICGSPYAIAEYQVDPSLGGEKGLQHFRTLLHRYGLKLILDFVPNHVALDHPWVLHRPQWLVGSDHALPGTFRPQGESTFRWMAHGKDPYFAPWSDTAQVDWRLEEVHEAKERELASIAERCDGVRADMAMLILRDRFRKQWSAFPIHGREADAEFWPRAIDSIRRRYPGFLFVAEAYWDLEPELLRMGFDFAYDKRSYDFLLSRQHPELKAHLRARHADLWLKGARFLENHDERRIASLVSTPEHRSWAVALLGLPGLRLLHEGQLDGREDRADIRTVYRAPVVSDEKLRQFYREWLSVLRSFQLGRCQPHLLDADSVSLTPARCDHVVTWAWSNDQGEVILGCSHLKDENVEVRIPLPVLFSGSASWECSPIWGTHSRVPHGRLDGDALIVSLAGWEAQVFRLRGRSGNADGRGLPEG